MWTAPTRRGRPHMNFAPEARQRTEQSRVHHIGTFPELEDQMTSFIADIRPGGFDQRGL